jgi:two-component system CheB/CheR fusion protein
LREDEVVGKHLLTLDIGMPVERLKQPVRAALSDASNRGGEVVVDATNRRGKAIRCHVSINQLLTPAKEVRGLILVMGERLGDSDATSHGGIRDCLVAR